MRGLNALNGVSGTSVAVALLAGLAVWLLGRPSPSLIVRGWKVAPNWASGPPEMGLRATGPGAGLVAGPAAGLIAGLAGVCAVGLAFTPLGGRRVVLIGVVAAAAFAGAALWRRRRREVRAELLGARVLEACEALAADLAAGQPPRTALERVGREIEALAPLTGVALLGADVPHALRDLARTPGAGDLRLVASAWQVAERSGAGLAPALTRVADGLRDRRRTARLVRAELASAWAATRLMAGLPVLFCLAGSGLGADPWSFLTATTPGLVCLVAGLGAAMLGVAWLQRIAAAVEAD